MKFAVLALLLQSEDALKDFNEQLAATWSRVGKPKVREQLDRSVQDFVGDLSGSISVKRASVEAFDLDSPPTVEALSPQSISLRIPSGHWRIRIKARIEAKVRVRSRVFGRKIKWGTITDTFNVTATLKGFRIGARIELDPGGPQVRRIIPSFHYDLDLESSNHLVDGLGRLLSSIVDSRLARALLKVSLSLYLTDLLEGWPNAQPTSGTHLSATPGAVDFEAAARAMRDRAVSNHMPHGTLVDTLYSRGNLSEPIAHGRQGDSATYTGHWLAGQALAYRVTKDPRAQEAAKKALRGIARLLEVGSSPDRVLRVLPQSHWGRLVRYAGPASETPSWNELGRPIPVKRIEGREWMGHSKMISRDQYVGVLQGLIWSLECLDDPEAVSLARASATRIANYVLDNSWNLDTPAGEFSASFVGQFLHQLTILVAARRADPFQFGPILDRHGSLADLAWFVGWILTSDPQGKYYRFNLFHTALSTLLHFDKAAARWPKYRYAWQLVWRTVQFHQNAYFSTVAAMADPRLAPQLRGEVGEILKQWLARKGSSEMPTADVSPETAKYWADLRARGKTRGYAPQIDFNIGLGGEIESEDREEIVATEILPPRHRFPRSYLWSRSPYSIGEGAERKAEVTHFPAADYQIAYWLARFLGLVAPDPDRRVAPPISATPRPIHIRDELLRTFDRRWWSRFPQSAHELAAIAGIRGGTYLSQFYRLREKLRQYLLRCPLNEMRESRLEVLLRNAVRS